MGKILAIVALSLCATAAYAGTATTTTTTTTSQSELQQWDNYLDQFGEQIENAFWSAVGVADPDQNQSATAVPAPEFDPAGAIAALTLLAGGLAVARGRRIPK